VIASLDSPEVCHLGVLVIGGSESSLKAGIRLEKVVESIT